MRDYDFFSGLGPSSEPEEEGAELFRVEWVRHGFQVDLDFAGRLLRAVFLDQQTCQVDMCPNRPGRVDAERLLQGGTRLLVPVKGDVGNAHEIIVRGGISNLGLRN